MRFQDWLLLNAGQKYCRMLHGGILQYFRPTLSYHLSFRPLFCPFLSGRLKDRFDCTLLETSFASVMSLCVILYWSKYQKIINGRPRECHNKKAQPIPSTKRKRTLQETETTKLHVNSSRKTTLGQTYKCAVGKK